MKKNVLLLLIGLAAETAVIGIAYTAYQQDFAFCLSFAIALLLVLIELLKILQNEKS